MCRREDDSQHYDCVKRDHPFGTDVHIQPIHLRVDTTIHQPQDMGRVQDLFHQYHIEQERAVTAAVNGLYTATVKIYTSYRHPHHKITTRR